MFNTLKNLLITILVLGIGILCMGTALILSTMMGPIIGIVCLGILIYVVISEESGRGD